MALVISQDKIFFHKTFSEHMLICQNAEGVDVQRKVGNLSSKALDTLVHELSLWRLDQQKILAVFCKKSCFFLS